MRLIPHCLSALEEAMAHADSAVAETPSSARNPGANVPGMSPGQKGLSFFLRRLSHTFTKRMLLLLLLHASPFLSMPCGGRVEDKALLALAFPVGLLPPPPPGIKVAARRFSKHYILPLALVRGLLFLPLPLDWLH